MKKTLSIVGSLAIFAAILSAQDTTWTNPASQSVLPIPQSIISTVSNGAVYDGIDVLLSSPAELSNYSGVSVYASMGDYKTWSEDGNVSVEFGSLLPVKEMEAGFVGTFDRLYTNELTGWSTTPTANYSLEPKDHNVDSDNDGINGYTNSETYNYTDKALSQGFKGGVGIDLGFMGVSLYGNTKDQQRTRGGTYDYKWTVGPDVGTTAVAELNPIGKGITTSKNVKYGFDKDGKAIVDPIDDTAWQVALTGQYPWTLLGIPIPLTATLRMDSHQRGIGDGIPQSVSITDGYVSTDGAGGTANDISTLSYTVGVSGMSSAAISGTHLGTGLTVNQATMAAAAAAADLGYATDPASYKNDDFTFAVACGADPKIALSDTLTARTRALFDLGFSQGTNNNVGTKSVSFGRADSATENSTYTYAASTSSSSSSNGTVITLECGGILEAKSPSGFLVVSSGFFYNPTFDLSTIAHAQGTTTITASAKDKTGTNPEATASTALTDIALGKTQGTVTQSSVVNYSGSDSDDVNTHRFFVPVTAQFNVVKDKLSFLCGCLLSGTMTNEITETAAYTTSTTTSVSTSSGTSLTSSPAAVDVATAGASNLSWTELGWNGTLRFLIRWIPQENLTVDIYGRVITDVLDTDQFLSVTSGSDNHDGFQIDDLASNLGISLTFHM
jgi:hypothetical protein